MFEHVWVDSVRRTRQQLATCAYITMLDSSLANDPAETFFPSDGADIVTNACEMGLGCRQAHPSFSPPPVQPSPLSLTDPPEAEDGEQSKMMRILMR